MFGDRPPRPTPGADVARRRGPFGGWLSHQSEPGVRMVRVRGIRRAIGRFGGVYLVEVGADDRLAGNGRGCDRYDGDRYEQASHTSAVHQNRPPSVTVVALARG